MAFGLMRPIDEKAVPTKGFALHNSERLDFPVLLAVPHAGREYPTEIFQQSRLPAASLVRLEDRYADLLVKVSKVACVPTIIASRARAWIDLNRCEGDLDLDMVKDLENRGRKRQLAQKARGGLGLVPRRLSGEGDIWNGPLAAADIQKRLSGYHEPYHTKIASTLAAIRAKFGVAILLDIHSMPPLSPWGQNRPVQFVIGDRFGMSSANIYSSLICECLEQSGFSAKLNHPYSGDYILARHGNPRQNIHAIQLEVDRSLYLDEILREPADTVGNIASLLYQIVIVLSETVLASHRSEAAE
jgi:N-formylglutamate amidohydrolase